MLQHEHNRNITAEESSYLDNVVEYIEGRWNEHSGVSAGEPEVLTEMRVQVASAQFKTDLSENGFCLTEAVLNNLSELVKSTSRIWKLEDIAQAYTTGGNWKWTKKSAAGNDGDTTGNMRLYKIQKVLFFAF